MMSEIMSHSVIVFFFYNVFRCFVFRYSIVRLASSAKFQNAWIVQS